MYISEFQIETERWENFFVRFRLIRRGRFIPVSFGLIGEAVSSKKGSI
jgi:hypothetical protein